MTAAWIKALVLICIFGAIVLAVESLISWYARNRSGARAINFRLKLIGQGRTHSEALSILRRTDSTIPEGLPPLAARLAKKFEHTLAQARVTMKTGQLMLLMLAAPAALFFSILLVLFAGGVGVGFGKILMVATFALMLGFVLPLMFLQFKAGRMRRKIQEQFPVALDVFVRGLRAGHPIAAALDLLTVELTDPIGTEFGIVVDEVTYGADLRDALENMAERWDMDDMRMFVVSLSVQSETGGNLAEILDNLSRVIRERASMMLKVRALSSEGRMTAVMLTALPILAFTSLFILNPSFYLDVSDDPAFVPGFVGLIALYLTGYFTIRKMVNLKV
jgi:tight adherence protein B